MLSSNALQIIAMICMLIDHAGLYLFSNSTPMRIIGRIAMPIFVFGLVKGFIHTSSRLKYFARLVITAIVTQGVLFLLNSISPIEAMPNILFNFLLAFIALLCLEKGDFFIFAIPFLGGAAEILSLDYGWSVVVLATGYYLCVRYLKKNNPLYYICLAAVIGIVNYLLSTMSHAGLQLFATLSVLPIALYNGKKGRKLPKYAGYIFYPAHLFAIYLVLLLLY